MAGGPPPRALGNTQGGLKPCLDTWCFREEGQEEVNNRLNKRFLKGYDGLPSPMLGFQRGGGLQEQSRRCSLPKGRWGLSRQEHEGGQGLRVDTSRSKAYKELHFTISDPAFGLPVKDWVTGAWGRQVTQLRL